VHDPTCGYALPLLPTHVPAMLLWDQALEPKAKGVTLPETKSHNRITIVQTTVIVKTVWHRLCGRFPTHKDITHTGPFVKLVISMQALWWLGCGNRSRIVNLGASTHKLAQRQHSMLGWSRNVACSCVWAALSRIALLTLAQGRG